GATVVVLATGMYQRLGVCPETLRLLEQKNVPVHVLQTEKAVRRYNELIETEAAGALIHSTC
ncbi:MAG: MTH938/NDUFAF3 family protein, partial [Planctomycetota bacterium]